MQKQANGTTRVGINGMGAIGRETLKIFMKCKDIEVVGINDVVSAKQIAYGLKYDSIYGPSRARVESNGADYLVINGKKMHVFNETSPSKIDWQSVKADIVIDSTGKFLTLQADLDAKAEKEGKVNRQEGADRHDAASVILSAPAKDSPSVPFYVVGVNDSEYSPDVGKVISNASCTTNCALPIIKVIRENYTIQWGRLLTVHAYTADQKLQDMAHSDLRRGRAAGMNIVPTSTGAHKAIIAVYPDLKGKLSGDCLRVPVPTGSLVDLTLQLDRETDAKTLNALFKAASQKQLKGVLGYTEDSIVSSDIIGSPLSSLVDGLLTKASGNMVVITSWYDNVFAYSKRLAELTSIVAGRMR